MRHPFRLTGLALGSLVLAACGEKTTEPNQAADQLTTTELAVAGNTWLTRANMPADRTRLAAATITNAAGQSIVYAIGGLTPTGKPSDKVTAYNVATNTWTFRRPLPEPLAETNGAGVIDGKIYVSGGYSDPDFPTSALYMYNPATNAWTEKTGIPTVIVNGEKQYGLGLGVTGVIGGRLYVLSGCFMAWPPWGYYEECNPLFFRYNPVTDRWTTLPPPFAGEDAGSPYAGGVIGGKFYLMAGSWYSRQGRLAVYDPATNRWTTKTPLGLSRPGAATAVLEGKLYVMGGRRYNAKREAYETLDITIVYDPATDTWTRRAPLPSARSDIAASRVFLGGQPRIEVVGGRRPGNNVQYVP
jgi:N-acetylneuraminic acid mutarotase